MQPLDQTEIVAVVTLEMELAPNLGFLYVWVFWFAWSHIHDKDNGIAVMMGMMRRAISVGNEGGRGGAAHGEAPINPG